MAQGAVTLGFIMVAPLAHKAGMSPSILDNRNIVNALKIGAMEIYLPFIDNDCVSCLTVSGHVYSIKSPKQYLTY